MNPDEITPPQFKQTAEHETRDAAVSVIRGKLDALYTQEPDAKLEAKEVLILPDKTLSKHQKFMKDLTESDKNTAEVQTAWHEYYQALPENEKHEVWQEFYSEQAKQNKLKKVEATRQKAEAEKVSLAAQHATSHHQRKKTVNPYISASTAHVKKIKDNHHVRSLFFGLSMGFLVIFILLFSFFNERFIIPFIRPNGHVSATSIIVDPFSNGPVGPESTIIIPKLNVEAPVVYDVPTIDEKSIQSGLERGVVHYGTTPNPGETGNSVIFGHSSGNILNKGKYKFAFILLKSLDKGDTFILQKDGKRFVYKIYNKYVTMPTDFSVLDPSDRPAIVTLITCDPPGTSTNRLIVQAEQIFPDPATNVKSAVQNNKPTQPDKLPSNSPSLWHRLFGN